MKQFFTSAQKISMPAVQLNFEILKDFWPQILQNLLNVFLVKFLRIARKFISSIFPIENNGFALNLFLNVFSL